jgi:uncharacterized damage-inducible protein DinB
MDEIDRLRDQLGRAVNGGAWHGPALAELLGGVDAAAAAARPIAGAHTIWEVALHADAWQRIVARRLAGEAFREMPPEIDWPPVTDTRAAAWEAVRAGLREGRDKLDATLSAFPAARLDETVRGSRSTYYATVHGLVQHHVYHAGQVALLLRALGRGTGGPA